MPRVALVAQVSAAFLMAGCTHHGNAGQPVVSNGMPYSTGMPLSDGLQLVDAIVLPNTPTGTPHATQLTLHGSSLYVPDTGALLRASMTAPGVVGEASVLTLNLPATQSLYCTSAAIHPASSTLFCTGPRESFIWGVNLSAGTLKGSVQVTTTNPAPGLFDVAVQGDSLLVATTIGLLKFPIDSYGNVDQSQMQTVYPGAVAAVAVDGTRVYLADRDKDQLVMLDGATTQAFDVSGPILRIRLSDDHRVGLALGSEGAWLLDPTAGTHVTFQTHGIVTSVAVSGGLVGLAGTDGTYLFTVDNPGQWIGFDTAEFGVTDCVWIDGYLYSLDWRTLRVYAIDLKGTVTRLELPGGYVLKPGQGVRFPVRNGSTATLHTGGQAVAPGAVGWITVPPSDTPSEQLAVKTDEQDDKPKPVYIVRDAQGPVGIGDVLFPGGLLASCVVDIDQGDCAILIAERMSRSWKLRHHLQDAGRNLCPVLVLPFTLAQLPAFAAEWSFPDGSVQHIDTLVPPSGTGDYFNDRLAVDTYIGGADIGLHYLVDDKGIVTSFDRFDRGHFQLPPAEILSK